ncbi:dipicolinate synthase subunit B [Anaerofilum sp. BX8]|uniref:Dipicolinate synthase subunit B n=1 Tax=Anaerofilum hominis TaxID=2763016 RepID=A0A923I727_9FIRM|nr:dipicolinate synthase subunit B [Anaerofilum hominis]MBC5580334.1 dipicolinate synthase subunit B [Anaerofilum hominis]
MRNTTIIYGLSGSFCNFERSLKALEELVSQGAEVIPAMSFNAGSLDTRFGTAAEFRRRLTEITGHEIIDTIQAAEPVGPKKLCDLLVISPCTGNTMSKLACGITDTPITMACKSHLRCGRPVVLALASNDSLSASAQNLGRLLNTKNYYFVPLEQDDWLKKPSSLVADFSQLSATVESALRGRQIQPIFF